MGMGQFSRRGKILQLELEFTKIFVRFYKGIPSDFPAKNPEKP